MDNVVCHCHDKLPLIGACHERGLNRSTIYSKQKCPIVSIPVESLVINPFVGTGDDLVGDDQVHVSNLSSRWLREIEIISEMIVLKRLTPCGIASLHQGLRGIYSVEISPVLMSRES